jgi:HlyD family secretion protein
MQEARLKARLAQTDFITYPTDLEAEYRNPEWERSLTQQQQILSMNMREDAELLAPLRRLSNQAESELMDAKATKQAIRKQLAAARTRLNNIKALKDQGVVYEKGVYTEPLYITLQATIEELKREFKNQSDAVKTAQQRLVDTRSKLEEKRLQRGQGLRANLRETQLSIMRIKTKLEALTLKQEPFDVHAPEDGIIERLHTFAPGESISPHSTLMALRTPGSKGLLEVSLPSTEIQRIDSGQPVIVSFSQPGNSIRSVYMGRVKTHTHPTSLQGLENGPQKLWVEIDIPASREHATRPLTIGMVGEVSIEFEDKPLWRSLADGYVRLNQ